MYWYMGICPQQAVAIVTQASLCLGLFEAGRTVDASRMAQVMTVIIRILASQHAALAQILRFHVLSMKNQPYVRSP